MKGCKVLKQEEVKRLLQVAESEQEKMLVLVGLYFGTRISESMMLKFGDFDSEYAKIKRNKNSNDTLLFVPEEFKSALKCLVGEYRRKGIQVNSDTPLFVKKNGKSFSVNWAHRKIQELFQRAEISGQVGAHSFRKCFVTRIYELCEKDIVQTALYSGHKNLTTLIYYIETTKETNLTAQLSWA